MQFLVCSIPGDASARTRTRSPGCQVLRERNVEGGMHVEEREKNMCVPLNTWSFPSLLLVHLFLNITTF